MEPNRCRTRIERARIRPNYSLPQVRRLQPRIPQIPLHKLSHRPLVQHPLRLGIIAQPPINLLRRRSITDPRIGITLRPKRIPRSPNHIIHGTPARYIRRSKPPDLRLARRIVIPKLNARPIQKRHEQSVHRRSPLKSPPHQSQLAHDARMQQPRQICARRHMHARKRFLNRASPTHSLPRLQHKNALTRTSQVRSAGQPIVPSAHHDHVPTPRRKFPHRSRKPDFAQHCSSR